ncbi:2TM domain-containing protein [Bacillus sp. Bva_UNVM-123]
MNNKQKFYLHLIVFLAAHIVLNIFIRLEKAPKNFENIQDIFKSNKIWFYFSEVNVTVIFIWLIILIIDFFFVFLNQKKS